MTRPTLSVGSLFSGVGALDLGLIRTGAFHVAYHVENEPFCQRILAERYPDVPTYEDITQCYGAGKAASADNVSRTYALPAVDVLVGGFPCTDISSSGTQTGIDDGKASGLWREFARLIGEIRPKYCIIENVAALRSPTRKKGQAIRAAGLGRVLGDLATLGYDAEWHCLPAARLGAPHRRDRIFILAYAPSQQQQGDTCRVLCQQGRESPRIWGEGIRQSDGQTGTDFLRSGNEGVAHAAAIGLERPELLRQPDGVGAWPRDAGSNGSKNGVGLADTDRTRFSQWRGLRANDEQKCATPQRGGALAADGRGAPQDNTSQPGICRDTDELTMRLDAVRQQYRWPARPGEFQYSWEPPRVTQEAVPDRVARIKALGNAVVVAVGQAVGELLLYRIEQMQQDQRERED